MSKRLKNENKEKQDVVTYEDNEFKIDKKPKSKIHFSNFAQGLMCGISVFIVIRYFDDFDLLIQIVAFTLILGCIWLIPCFIKTIIKRLMYLMFLISSFTMKLML